MRNIAIAGLAVLSMTALASEAGAQQAQFPRWYVGLAGSVNFMSNADVTGGTTVTEVSYDPGWGAGASVGYLPDWGFFFDSVRLEFEVTYRSNPVDRLEPGVGAATGEFTHTAYMANVYYDYMLDRKWLTYIGGGMGIAEFEFDRDPLLGNVNSKDTNLAWQLMIGLGYRPDSMPLTEWSFGYRYFGASATELDTATTLKIDLDTYSSHGLEAGVKLRF